MTFSASGALGLFRRPLLALACLAALALVGAGATSQAQDQKDPDKKVQDKKDQDKKDADKKAQDKKDTDKKAQDKKDQDKKDTDKKAQDKKKEAKKGSQTAKYETPKIEPIDTRIYPKADPVMEIKGHTDWINRVAFTPDAKFLVTASRDRTLRIWEAANGKEVLKIKDLPADAVALAISPDGSKLATTAGKWNKEKQLWVGAINIYDAKTGKLISTIQGHAEPIEAVAFDPKGTALATASQDGAAKVWDVATGKELHYLKGHTGQVAAVIYSADGKWIATGGEDKTVRIWDSSTGKEKAVLKGPSRRVAGLAFSPDGKQLAGGSDDGTITIWETGGTGVRVLKAGEGVLTVAFSPDGTKLASGGWEKAVQIWDLQAGKELGGLAGHTNSVSCVVFNTKGDQVVSASLDQTVRIWNVNSVTQKVEPPKKK